MKGDHTVCIVLEIKGHRVVVESNGEKAVMIYGDSQCRKIVAGERIPLMTEVTELVPKVGKEIVAYFEQSHGLVFITDWGWKDEYDAAKAAIKGREVQKSSVPIAAPLREKVNQTGRDRRQVMAPQTETNGGEVIDLGAEIDQGLKAAKAS